MWDTVGGGGSAQHAIGAMLTVGQNKHYGWYYNQYDQLNPPKRQGPLKTVVGRENRIFETLSQKHLENTTVKALWPNTELGRAITITSVKLN